MNIDAFKADFIGQQRSIRGQQLRAKAKAFLPNPVSLKLCQKPQICVPSWTLITVLLSSVQRAQMLTPLCRLRNSIATRLRCPPTFQVQREARRSMGQLPGKNPPKTSPNHPEGLRDIFGRKKPLQTEMFSLCCMCFLHSTDPEVVALTPHSRGKCPSGLN